MTSATQLNIQQKMKNKVLDFLSISWLFQPFINYLSAIHQLLLNHSSTTSQFFISLFSAIHLENMLLCFHVFLCPKRVWLFTLKNVVIFSSIAVPQRGMAVYLEKMS